MQVKVIVDTAIYPNIKGGDMPKTFAYPQATVLKDNTVVCVYRGGEEKHTYDGVLYSQWSKDMGHTWSEPLVTCDFRHITPPESVLMPGVCRAADDSLLAVFTNIKPDTDQYIFSEEGLKQARVLYYARSEDGGLSWAKPRHLDSPTGYQRVAVTGKPLLLPNGEVMIPLDAHPEVGARTTVAAFSSDNGQTIGPFTDLELSGAKKETFCCDARFDIVNDQVLTLLWTFREDTEETIEVHRSVSHDNGRSWSSPHPVGFVGQVTVPLAIGDEKVIAASNFRHPPQGIRLWFSEDLGVTWERPPIQMWDSQQSRIVAEPMEASANTATDEGVWEALRDFSFGTPDLVRMADGTILMLYYATLNGRTHIRCCHFEVIV